VLGEPLGHRECLRPAVGAVGVHEQLDVGADRLTGAATRSGSSAGRRPIFIFTARIPAEAHSPNWLRRRSIEYEVKPPLP